MRFIIYLGLSLIGAVLGGAVGMSLSQPPDWLVYTFMVTGMFLGIYATRCLYRYVVPPRRRKSQPRETSANQPNVPFADRLRHFSGSDASDRPDDFVSTMTFWMQHSVHEATPPKPAHLIRRILMRIRKLIQSASSP